MTDDQASDLIDTTENQAIEDEPKNEAAPAEQAQISGKSVKDLTNDERSKLIADAKAGQDNEFFKVSFDRNGRSRISKKKAPKQTTAAKIIEKKAPHLTSEQLLMEHVIGLESQLSTLAQKHNNLKKKYKRMYEDVYIDDEEFYKAPEVTPSTEPQPQQQQEPQPHPIDGQALSSQDQVVLPNIRRYGWRARINPTL